MSADTRDTPQAAPGPPTGPSRSGPLLTVREMTLIALLSALVVVGKWVLRMPISVSGHSGVLWIATMVIGRGLLRRTWAATAIGVVGGLLVVVAVPGSEGLLNWFKYIAAGVTMDACALVFRGNFTRVPYAAVSGALAHTAKLTTDLVLGVMSGIPLAALAVGLGLSAVSHAAFGLLGGIIGAFVLKALARAGIGPRLDGVTETGDAS